MEERERSKRVCRRYFVLMREKGPLLPLLVVELLRKFNAACLPLSLSACPFPVSLSCVCVFTASSLALQPSFCAWLERMTAKRSAASVISNFSLTRLPKRRDGKGGKFQQAMGTREREARKSFLVKERRIKSTSQRRGEKILFPFYGLKKKTESQHMLTLARIP